jgi:non-specific serine/threonine protein kinase/serine/threonine-protein kinase
MTSMTFEAWNDVDRLVGDALELPEADRHAFVLASCAERRDLADTVLALLAEDGRGGPLDVLDAVEASLHASLAGVRLGPYRLIREIGRGGMGTVWLAERDDQQYQKRVAVKILSPSLPASEALRRFREERQILASLDHPNIARLLDAGRSDGGLHYFIMEFVDGTPIGDYCHDKNLDIRARAALLRTIASTVHFAHQRLVVHRDLKPANILVTPEGEPRLLDFGIAKMLAPDATSATVPLLHLATPAYASPEQLQGSPATTASDVYSLGILSGELLGGGLPLRTSGEVERPSAVAKRVALDHSGREASAALAGDLDAIVVKATQPLPQDRYASADDLATDLARYLAGRPVAARGGAVRYRILKFVARHRAAVAVAAVAALAAAAGIVATVWQSRVASRERQVAEARFNDVRQLARAMITDVYDRIAFLPGSTDARHSLVTHALLYLNRLAGDKNVDRDLALELVNGYLRIGQVQFNNNIGNLGDTDGALQSYAMARQLLNEQLKQTPGDVEIRRLLARTYGFSAEVQQYLRNHVDARESVEALVRIRESLATSGVPEDRRGLASAYYQLGSLLDSDGGQAAAIDAKRKSLELFEALLSETPADRDAQRNVALASKSLGATLESLKQDEAERHFRRALALDEARAQAEPGSALARMDVSFDLSSLGTLLADRNIPEAVRYFERTIEIRRSLADADPKDARARARLAYALLRSGRARMQFGNHTGAVEDLAAAVVLADHLLSANPNDSMARSYAAEGLNNLSASEDALARAASEPERSGHARRACDALRRAVGHYRLNIQNGTADAADRRDVSSAERRLAGCGS